MERQQNIIRTGLGSFSKEKFKALVNVRAVALEGLREALKSKGYIEVTSSSLVNIAGSCENPNASFTLNYYGREAHLSQSAQIQLENLVLGLKQGVFTINNSFREENYDDPEAEGRRLSEFTLIEPEKPYKNMSPEEALAKIIEEKTEIIKHVINKVIEQCFQDMEFLGGNIDFLKKIVQAKFPIITYDKALEILNKSGKYKFGDDLGILEERAILKHFGNIPTFVTHYPAAIKFFNMKRTPDGQRVYSVDLLMPKLGETTGGAVREEDVEKIKQQLRESKIAEYLKNKPKADPVLHFPEYFNILEQSEPVLRGGYGIGFERFVGFLLQSNDILDTVAYRTLHP